MNDGLKDSVRDQILETLAEHPRVERAVLFGSRAMGTHTPGSDIDIALSGEELTTDDVAELAAHFAESAIPHTVDLVHEPSIDSEELRTHIRDHGVTWLANGSWRIRSLYDVADYINGRATKPSEVVAEGVPVIKIAELRGGISAKTDRIDASAVQEKHWVREGDLLFAWSGSVGVHIYRGPQAALNQHIFRVVARPRIDQRFLRYLLLAQMEVFQRFVDNKRTTMGHVTIRDLQATGVLVPPLPDQQAIAHILGTLDDKIELNRRMSKTLEAMARALFRSWFVDFDPVRAKAEGRDPGLPKPLAALFPDRLVDSELGEIPEGWEVKAVGDLADVTGGATPSTRESNYWGGPHHWATPKDLSALSFPVLLDTGRRITDTGLRRISSGLLPVGTVLVSSRAPIGYLAIAEIPVAINQGLIAMRPKADVSNLFLLHWAHESHEGILRNANGSTFLEISKMNFRSIPAAAPPVLTMAAFDQITRPLYSRVVTSERELRSLASLRDALLPGLVSGELPLKDVGRYGSQVPR